jgi:hypothetical protein
VKCLGLRAAVAKDSQQRVQLWMRINKAGLVWHKHVHAAGTYLVSRKLDLQTTAEPASDDY